MSRFFIPIRQGGIFYYSPTIMKNPNGTISAETNKSRKKAKNLAETKISTR
jgi:hypothetical protein